MKSDQTQPIRRGFHIRCRVPDIDTAVEIKASWDQTETTENVDRVLGEAYIAAVRRIIQQTGKKARQ
jgi:hypothetical protein